MPIPGLVEAPVHEAKCTGGCTGCPCTQEEVAPVLVLAIGNPLMADDGAGQEILAKLESSASEWASNVQFVDGGTQGLALLGLFEKRKAVVFLDAVRLGFQPGSVHVLSCAELLRMGSRPASAHEGSAPDILRALELLTETPSEVTLVGIEPERIETGIGLTPVVRNSIGLAAGFARAAVNGLVADGSR
jgi:hydrogenase maturation protease